MDFMERNRIPGCDEFRHRLGFGLGLIRIVAIQIEAVSICSGVVRTPIGVFDGYKEEEHLIKNLSGIERPFFDLVVTTEFVFRHIDGHMV